ncbi:MAG TPA: LysM peptidoglycan-binding domain-containing protein, partial [Pseudomonadales bacterium]|nr:LysM peptidoglycan-binding domain-containing protein [Pseudomonadales bacterium]
DYWSLPLSAQACNYVPRLIALSRVLESPEQHGVALSALPNSASWVPVEVGARVDLNRVASRAGIDAQELRGVNPAYGSGITPAQSGNSVLVPAEDRDRFVAALAHAPASGLGQRQDERYRVRKGDTLLAIARLYRTSVDALRAINESDGDELREGQWLLLPDDAVPPRRQFATSETLALKEQGIYTVRAGDTLSAIASRFGVRTSELVALNRIDTRMTLRVGQKLRVRAGNDPVVAAAASPTISGQSYTVRAGDSIARIATRLGVRMADLLAWNRLDPSRPLIHPGQILVLHPPKSAARVVHTR